MQVNGLHIWLSPEHLTIVHIAALHIPVRSRERASRFSVRPGAISVGGNLKAWRNSRTRETQERGKPKNEGNPRTRETSERERALQQLKHVSAVTWHTYQRLASLPSANWLLALGQTSQPCRSPNLELPRSLHQFPCRIQPDSLPSQPSTSEK